MSIKRVQRLKGNKKQKTKKMGIHVHTTEREGGRTQAEAGDGEGKGSWQAMKQPRSPWRLEFIGPQLRPPQKQLRPPSLGHTQGERERESGLRLAAERLQGGTRDKDEKNKTSSLSTREFVQVNFY